MAESRVAAEVPHQEVPRGGEFLAHEAHPHQPCPHRELGVLRLLGLVAGALGVLRHLAQRQRKLYECLELPGVDAVLLVTFGLVELEEPELNGALGEGCVQVEGFMLICT